MNTYRVTFTGFNHDGMRITRLYEGDYFVIRRDGILVISTETTDLVAVRSDLWLSIEKVDSGEKQS